MNTTNPADLAPMPKAQLRRLIRRPTVTRPDTPQVRGRLMAWAIASAILELTEDPR